MTRSAADLLALKAEATNDPKELGLDLLPEHDAATDWVWDTKLNRFAMNFGGSNDYVVAMGANSRAARPEARNADIDSVIQHKGTDHDH